MKPVLAILVLLIPLSLQGGEATDPGLVLASGGELSLTFYRGNLRDAGLRVEGTRPLDFQHDAARLDIAKRHKLKFNTASGYFESLGSGYLSLVDGLTITAPNLRLESRRLRVKPMGRTRDVLQLSDARGRDWFYLDYGHYERDGQWLYARYLDMRIGRDLARQLGDPTLQGFLIGTASLKTRINPQADPQSDQLRGITANCPVSDPNWPTLDGFDADVAMLSLEHVNQVARDGGRVAIAPSAYFENIGSADLPWFAQFADTRNVDACCADQGEGVCAPYGNDQGGMLVYHLYRFVDGRLEQLGQSHVKHAFNSINAESALGSVACIASNRPGRVVPSGCEDLYQVSSNANQSFLGPREEIIAHTGTWLRDGSIWDLTGPMGTPDGNCDYLPDILLYGGQVPCEAPVSDAMDRRLSVAETELLTPGARYFIEAWYVVRDDIDVFNSIGRKEINPTFTTVWTFPEVQPFQQGPVVDDFLVLQDADTGSMIDTIDTGEGHLRVASTVKLVAPGQWQYDVALMNMDFDRAIDRFDIPVSQAVAILSTGFFDGDDEAANDWSVSNPSGLLRFQAPGGEALKWGSLASFRFVADDLPNAGTATLGVAQAGEPGTLSVNTFTSTELSFRNGFENPE